MHASPESTRGLSFEVQVLPITSTDFKPLSSIWTTGTHRSEKLDPTSTRANEVHRINHVGMKNSLKEESILSRLPFGRDRDDTLKEMS